MPLILRAVVAFLVLPGVVAFLVPLLFVWPALRVGARPCWSGVIPFVAGVAALVWCIREFLVAGKGTLAPWDPPRRVVVTGPYALSRNPMYVAVVLILVGWTLMYFSGGLLLYTLIVMAAFHLRVVFGEERWLRRDYPEAWTRYCARVPRWIFSSWRTMLLSWLAVAGLLLIGGLVFEAYEDARAAREFPPPGMLVNIGGRRLHLVCIGQGQPTVLFEPSGWGNATSAVRARERISTRTRVCSYDRMGAGWSDPGPSVVTFSDLANDVAVLEDRAELGAPLVVVASSIGGLTAEALARAYPERVAGLVMVDAANSDLLPAAADWLSLARSAGCVAAGAARFGVIRLIDPFDLRAGTSDESRRTAAMTYGYRPWRTLCAMLRGAAREPDLVTKLPPLRADLPLAVLSASSDEGLFPGSSWVGDLRAQRVPAHKSFAKRSSRGTWKMVPKSTHLIASSQPDAVAETVLGMLEQIE